MTMDPSFFLEITQRPWLATTPSSPFLLNNVLLVFFIFLLSHITHCDAATGGFTVQLFRSRPIVHSPAAFNGTLSVKDSPQRIAATTNAHRIKAEVAPINHAVAFIMKLGIGTPPVELHAVLDTGSGLMWCQCQPCQNCYEQALPIFDSRQSSTYGSVTQDSHLCKALRKNQKDFDEESPLCNYKQNYADGTSTKGVISTETLSFDAILGPKKVRIPIGFGCAQTNVPASDATFKRMGGVVGVGRGPLSLISQLRSHIGYKFSYCLSEESASTMRFGDDAVFLGPVRPQRTPLVPSPPHHPSAYNLKLEDISVNNNRLHVPTDSISPNREGGFFIDSGTTMTVLSSDIFAVLKSALTDAMPHLKETVPPPDGFHLCYSVDSSSPSSYQQQEMPSVTFHFAGDAKWRVPGTRAFLNYDDNVLCSVFASSSEGISIFGNIVQQNFHVQFDLGKNMLSFAPADCSL